MCIALWTVQGLLAAAFLVSGATKLSQPKEKLLQNMAWVELLAAGGAPHRRPRGPGGVRGHTAGADGDLPWLTPLAALGLVLTMVGAALTHLGRAEYGPIAVTAVLLVMEAFVAYGRFFVLPA
jgi:uncharacterized membrane protein YphA (DoxX/SURF4 family)